MRQTFVRSAMALPLMILAAGLTAQESGKSSGVLTVGSSKVALAYSYAFPEQGDDGKERYRLLITDQPLSAAALKDEFARRELLLERKVHGLEIVVAADNRVVSGHLYHPDLPGSGLAVSGVHEFRADVFDAQRIAGTVFTSNPLDHMGKPVEYKSTFSTPVTRRRPITAADLESGPGKAAAAFLRAASVADVRALRAILTLEAQKELDGPDGKEILKVLPALVPRAMKITGLEVMGDTAIVTAEGGKQKVRFRAVQQNGQWKVTLPEG